MQPIKCFAGAVVKKVGLSVALSTVGFGGIATVVEDVLKFMGCGVRRLTACSLECDLQHHSAAHVTRAEGEGANNSFHIERSIKTHIDEGGVQSGFHVGDRVGWIFGDADIPLGSAGKVVSCTAEFATVRLPQANAI